MDLFFFLLSTYLAFAAVKQLLTCITLRHLARHGNEVPPGPEGRLAVDDLKRAQAYTPGRALVKMVFSLAGVAGSAFFVCCGLLDVDDTRLDGLALPGHAGGVLFFFLPGAES